MEIVNDVVHIDTHSNLSDLQKEYEKTKFMLNSVKEDRNKYYQEVQRMTFNVHELENQYQDLLD